MNKLLVLAVTMLATAAPVSAKEYVVKMLNKGAAGAMVFEPAMVKVAPGDTVKFVPTNPSHMAEAIPTMWVAGAPQFLQTLRTSRCAMRQRVAEATRKGLIPMSIKRVTAPRASLVCRVEKTK